MVDKTYGTGVAHLRTEKSITDSGDATEYPNSQVIISGEDYVIMRISNGVEWFSLGIGPSNRMPSASVLGKGSWKSDVMYLSDGVSYSSNSSIESIVNIRWFGAVGDGVTDDTDAINAAIQSSNYVFVPEGTFIANNINAWHSNLIFYGAGNLSIIKQSSGAASNANCLNLAHEGDASIANNLVNITIRDMQIRGYDDAPVFAEFTHLLAVSAVSGLIIDNVLFKGWKGDGVYIGSNLNATEMHNERIFITNCIFDGINKENRNAISIIDCDVCLIENCNFLNTTAPTMPGAIDLEPDNAFNNIQNITIQNNKFTNIGGNVGCVSMFYANKAYTHLLNKFVIRNNTFLNCNHAIAARYDGAVADISSQHIWNVQIIENDVSNCVRLFNLFGIRGAIVSGNSFKNCTYDASVGYTNIHTALDVNINNNTFYNCGNVGGVALSIFTASRVQITHNIFDDCGTGTPGMSNVIDFNSLGNSSYIDILYNQFKTTNSKSLFVVQTEATHTTDSKTNRYIGNNVSGIDNNTIKSNNSDQITQAWSPIIGGSMSDGYSTYTLQLGTYLKIGRRIDFTLVVKCTSCTATGRLKISLPERAQPNTPSSLYVCGTASITSTVYTGVAVPEIDTSSDVSGLPGIGQGCIYLSNSSLVDIAPEAIMTIKVSGSYISSITQ